MYMWEYQVFKKYCSYFSRCVWWNNLCYGYCINKWGGYYTKKYGKYYAHKCDECCANKMD